MSQTVVITGASAGIGRAAARLFGRRGANVVLLARGEAGLSGAALDVTEAGGKALPVDPSAVGVLRREARDQRVHRVGALRAAA